MAAVNTNSHTEPVLLLRLDLPRLEARVTLTVTGTLLQKGGQSDTDSDRYTASERAPE